jgi:hypothetical protein
MELSVISHRDHLYGIVLGGSSGKCRCEVTVKSARYSALIRVHDARKVPETGHETRT